MKVNHGGHGGHGKAWNNASSIRVLRALRGSSLESVAVVLESSREREGADHRRRSHGSWKVLAGRARWNGLTPHPGPLPVEGRGRPLKALGNAPEPLGAVGVQGQKPAVASSGFERWTGRRGATLSPQRGLELLGKQLKEFAEGTGPLGAERAGAIESLGRVRGERPPRAFLESTHARHSISVRHCAVHGKHPWSGAHARSR